MKLGDRVRVRRDHNIVFNIEREQFGSFGRKVSIKSMTDRMMPLTVWYGPEELEVIE